MSVPVSQFQASSSWEDSIARAASETRIEPEYWDVLHHLHRTSIDTQKRILAALGWDTSSQGAIDAQREQAFRTENTAVVSAVNVVGEEDRSIPLTFLVGTDGEICFDFQLEDGNQLRGSLQLGDLRETRQVEVGGQSWTVRQLPLPPELPLGYHRIRISRNGLSLGDAALILCPERAYLPPTLEGGGKMAGFNVTLYGLRSERNWGCGDFTDLQTLAGWASSIGFSFVGLNPLHALHNRTPYNTSPYLPLSIFYKNLIYIDVERVPEFERSHWAKTLFASPAVQNHLNTLRAADTVQYADVQRLKKCFLKLLYRQFRTDRAVHEGRGDAFRVFCEREGDMLDKFALYCSLDEVLHKQDRNRWTWIQWPAEYHSPNSEESRRFADFHRPTVEFYKYVQFVIEEQLHDAQSRGKQAGLAIGLYHDLALATDSCGADLWAYPHFYVSGCRVGSPPDDLSPNGQDWAFPPPHSATHQKHAYRLYRESIRKIVVHGGALRIDHVMRLFRLFWIPDGVSAADGAYVRDYAVELMRILALESVRSRNTIIGEDLGTVTDEIRDLLARFRILSYRLFYFERFPDKRFKPSVEYPRQALVASSTHDLATMCGFWANRDIEARRSAGLLDEGGYRNQIDERKRDRQSMLDILHAEGLLPPSYPRSAEQISDVDGPLHNAMVSFLARVPSMLLLLNQEDFTKETEQQNLPGTTAEYPNWQRKMRVRLEDLRSEQWAPFKEMFAAQLANSGRTP